MSGSIISKWATIDTVTMGSNSIGLVAFGPANAMGSVTVSGWNATEVIAISSGTRPKRTTHLSRLGAMKVCAESSGREL